MKLVRDIPNPPDTEGCGPLLLQGHDAPRPLRQQVFEFVRAQGRVARADITNALGISAGSTTTLTADLIAAGQLREFERQPRETGRGRPKITLEVVPEAAFVIGVKLAFDHHTAVLTDFAGNIVASEARASARSRRSLADLLDETNGLIDALLSRTGTPRARIAHVGIGLPGLVDHKTSRVLWSSLLTSEQETRSETFAQALALPVVLDNDANMLTLAELWFGQGRAMSDFAVVTVERGVGMGLVLGNQIYRGGHGMGLELGHTKVQMDGALCQCGQRGCLEAYLADYALLREATTALGMGATEGQPAQDVLTALNGRAEAGDPAAQTVYRRAGRFLSLALSNVVQLFDPDMIILSGAGLRYARHYEEEILKNMRAQTLNAGRRQCRVAFNDWDDLVWARGASALALSKTTDSLIGGETRAA